MIKKIIFGFTSLALAFNILFLPFVVDPFPFTEGVSENYIIEALLAIAFWCFLMWLNFHDLKDIKYLSFSNTLFNIGNEKSYYAILKISLRLATSVIILLIFLGIFSIIDQYEMFLKNIGLFEIN